MKTVVKALVIILLVTGIFCSACVPDPTIKQLESFKFNTPQSGDTLSSADAMTCSGSYAATENMDLNDVHVWLLLGDEFGNYYLQNPPVKFLPGGLWETSNIRVGSGMTKILAVQVPQAGHKAFQDKVQNNQWSAFLELPEGSEILAFVDIIVP